MPPVQFVIAGNAKLKVTEQTQPRADVADFYGTLIASTQQLRKIPTCQRATSEPANIPSSHLVTCPICNSVYDSSLQLQHQASITHQHAITRDSPPDPLYLNETNRGYQILVTQGWQDSESIGAEPGRRHPVATGFKNNHHGLGFDKKTRLRVTHDMREVMNANERKEAELRARQLRGSAKEARREYERDRLKRETLLAYMKR